MNIPDELKYTSEHEWVRVEGAVATVGITDYAQSSLGDVVYIDLPPIDYLGVLHEGICEIESTKSVSDIHSPLDGKVKEVNEALETEPNVVNADPYGAGWVFKIEITEPKQIDDLLDSEAYEALIS